MATINTIIADIASLSKTEKKGTIPPKSPLKNFCFWGLRDIMKTNKYHYKMCK